MAGVSYLINNYNIGCLWIWCYFYLITKHQKKLSLSKLEEGCVNNNIIRPTYEFILLLSNKATF